MHKKNGAKKAYYNVTVVKNREKKNVYNILNTRVYIKIRFLKTYYQIVSIVRNEKQNMYMQEVKTREWGEKDMHNRQ